MVPITRKKREKISKTEKRHFHALSSSSCLPQSKSMWLYPRNPHQPSSQIFSRCWNTGELFRPTSRQSLTIVFINAYLDWCTQAVLPWQSASTHSQVSSGARRSVIEKSSALKDDVLVIPLTLHWKKLPRRHSEYKCVCVNIYIIYIYIYRTIYL